MTFIAFLTILKPAKCHTKEKKRLLFIKPQNRETKPKATLSNETVWRTQVQLVELFQSSKSNISKHIFEEGNLAKKYPLFFRTGFRLKVRPRLYCRKRHTSSLVRTKKPRFRVVSKSAPNRNRTCIFSSAG